MSSTASPITRAFSTAAQTALAEHGWRKRSGEIYTLDRGDFLGWLGLNRATKHKPMRVNPVVGVRHQETEAKVAELMRTEPHTYLPPTISSPVGYLSTGRHHEVTVEDGADVARAAEELVALVQGVGRPFIDEHLGLAALIAGLAADRPLSANPPEYRLPVLLALNGETERARRVLDAATSARSGRTDAEADQYRAFATAAARWLRSEA